jgi:hypothetical protein
MKPCRLSRFRMECLHFPGLIGGDRLESASNCDIPDLLIWNFMFHREFQTHHG